MPDRTALNNSDENRDDSRFFVIASATYLACAQSEGSKNCDCPDSDNASYQPTAIGCQYSSAGGASTHPAKVTVSTCDSLLRRRRSAERFGTGPRSPVSCSSSGIQAPKARNVQKPTSPHTTLAAPPKASRP